MLQPGVCKVRTQAGLYWPCACLSVCPSLLTLHIGTGSSLRQGAGVRTLFMAGWLRLHLLKDPTQKLLNGSHFNSMGLRA